MFQQGLSGLNAASRSLDTIGNNIANASTVGFKSSQVQFGDVLSNSLNGLQSRGPGSGVGVSRISQQFFQGSYAAVSDPLSVSINGAGFYRLVDNGVVSYSRNGQFHEDETHTLVNAQGAQLTGWLADKAGNIQYGAPRTLTLDKSDVAPVTTTSANFHANLSSKETVKGVPFDANNPDSYALRSGIDVYDSLGGTHQMATYYVKTGANTWDVYAAADNREVVAQQVASAVNTDPGAVAARAAYQDAIKATPPDPQAISDAAAAYAQAAGTAMSNALAAANATPEQLAKLAAVYDPATGVGTQGGMTPDQIDLKLADVVSVPAVKVGSLAFDRNGNLDATATTALNGNQPLPLSITLPVFPDTGSNAPLVIQTSFNQTTQYGSATVAQDPSQNGNPASAWQSYAIDDNGVIVGRYTNGVARAMGQIALATFASNDGLIPLGDNAWAESSSSGPAVIGQPNLGPTGKLRANSVEASNVDLTSELVNMITAQRVYQANAQTIKTEDSMLQTLVNLR
jgi:flagellar hook protein FlgE